MIKLPRPRISWRPARAAVVSGLCLIFSLTLFFWRLASSPSHLSGGELAAKKASNLTALGNNIFFAPWRLVNDLALHLKHDSIFLQRSVSVMFGLICLVAFFYCLRTWLGSMIAAITSLFLLTTPLFLLASRSASPRIMYFWPIVLIAAYLIYWRSDRVNLNALSLVLVSATSLYVPGLIWLLLVLALFKWQRLREAAGDLSRKNLVIFGAVFLLAISPLILSLVIHPGLLRSYFLIPSHFASVINILKDWGWAFLSLFIKSKQHQELSLGRSAILDIAQIGLILFGSYALVIKLRQPLYLIIAGLVLITFLAGLSGNYYFLASLVVPLLVLAGFGLRFLYLEWLHTFPKNPLPRYFAYGLMITLVLIHLLYGIRYSLIAWPLA
jgi:hypothetical protein